MTDFTNNPEGFVSDVIRPVLTALGLDQDVSGATELLLGTALQESGLAHRVQLGGGPARGLFQMEPNTHDDIWANFLRFRAPLAEKVGKFLDGNRPNSQFLTNNDLYAAAMTRILYLRMGQLWERRRSPNGAIFPVWRPIGRNTITLSRAQGPPLSSLPTGKASMAQ